MGHMRRDRTRLDELRWDGMGQYGMGRYRWCGSGGDGSPRRAARDRIKVGEGGAYVRVANVTTQAITYTYD